MCAKQAWLRKTPGSLPLFVIAVVVMSTVGWSQTTPEPTFTETPFTPTATPTLTETPTSTETATPTETDFTPTPPPAPARLRVVHLSPDAPSVDVYDGLLLALFSNVAFGDTTPFQEMSVGDHVIYIVPAGGDPESISVLTIPITLDPGSETTLVAFDTLLQINGIRLDEDFDNVPAGGGRLRPIHTASGIGPVNILEVSDPENPQTLYTALGFGETGDYLDLPTGIYVIGLDVDDDGVADLVFSPLALGDGDIVNLFAVNDGGEVFILTQHDDGMSQELGVVVEETPTPSDTPTETPFTPTETPTLPPTDTPEPTSTPTETAFTPTDTPVPTETPTPTDTVVPTETMTPGPTNTPGPTSTPGAPQIGLLAVDGFMGIHPAGTAVVNFNHFSANSWPIHMVRDANLTADGRGVFVLDLHGFVSTYSLDNNTLDQIPLNNQWYFPPQDIAVAVRAAGTGAYGAHILLDNGQILPVGSAANIPDVNPALPFRDGTAQQPMGDPVNRELAIPGPLAGPLNIGTIAQTGGWNIDSAVDFALSGDDGALVLARSGEVIPVGSAQLLSYQVAPYFGIDLARRIERFTYLREEYYIVLDGMGGVHLAGPSFSPLRTNWNNRVLTELAYFGGSVMVNNIEVFSGLDAANDFVPVLKGQGDIGLIMLDGLGGLHYANLDEKHTSVRTPYFGNRPEANLDWMVSVILLD